MISAEMIGLDFRVIETDEIFGEEQEVSENHDIDHDIYLSPEEYAGQKFQLDPKISLEKQAVDSNLGWAEYLRALGFPELKIPVETYLHLYGALTELMLYGQSIDEKSTDQVVAEVIKEKDAYAHLLQTASKQTHRSPKEIQEYQKAEFRDIITRLYMIKMHLISKWDLPK